MTVLEGQYCTDQHDAMPEPLGEHRIIAGPMGVEHLVQRHVRERLAERVVDQTTRRIGAEHIDDPPEQRRESLRFMLEGDTDTSTNPTFQCDSNNPDIGGYAFDVEVNSHFRVQGAASVNGNTESWNQSIVELRDATVFGNAIFDGLNSGGRFRPGTEQTLTFNGDVCIFSNDVVDFRPETIMNGDIYCEVTHSANFDVELPQAADVTFGGLDPGGDMGVEVGCAPGT